VLARQPIADGAAFVLGNGIQLGPIAGRQQRDLAHRRQARARAPALTQDIVGKRHPFAQADRRGLMLMPRASKVIDDGR
jgi:hypothetical protein